MEEKVNELLNSIKECQRDICYLNVRNDREFLNHIKEDKAITYDLLVSLEKYLELKEYFIKSLEIRFNNTNYSKKEKEAIYNDIECRGIQREIIDDMLENLKMNYNLFKKTTPIIKGEVDKSKKELEDIKSRM